MENKINRGYRDILAESFRSNWNLPALTDLPGGSLTYAQAAFRIHALHKLFNENGIQPGDRIAICGRNCSAWAISFFAATTFGTVAVPLLHEFSIENIYHALNHSGSSILIASKEIIKNIDRQLIPAVRLIVDMSGLGEISTDVESFCASLHSYGHEDMLVLNYTSGTTSNPKGVMIPERAIVSNIIFGFEVMPMLKRGDTVLSILPMAHTYSMAFELLVEFAVGMNIHFLTRRLFTQYIMDSFAKVKPRVIIMVPLILEKIVKKGVVPVLNKPSVALLRKIPGVAYIINSAIRKKLYDTLGGTFYQIIVGGAALSKDVEAILKEIRFPFTIGYGMTECAPIIGYADWKSFVQGSCGKAAPRMRIAINGEEAGEILVSGANVMLGYYNNPEESAKVLDSDGWLHTGDVGKLDSKGNLFIMGRCKTMYLSGTGQNIYPEEIEDLLCSDPFITEALVVMRNNALVAMVYPNKEMNGSCKEITEHVLAFNSQLPVYEKIAGVEIMEHEFEKTPKKSIKRFLYN